MADTGDPRRNPLGDDVEPPPATPRLVDAGQIGKGGMSTVRKVVDTAFSRELAMKVISAGLASRPNDVQRFLDEARITAQLKHPHVPPVHELGATSDGRHFFTMKLVQGRTLDELMKEPTYSSADEAQLFAVLQIFTRVCEAVGFAHSRGVLHCDLKPSNVMVGTHGQVYLMDWGI